MHAGADSHPSSPRSRLLCLFGRHAWTTGKYVTHCARCYTQPTRLLPRLTRELRWYLR